MAQRAPFDPALSNEDEHRYDKTTLSPAVMSGMLSHDLGECILSLRTTMTYLTGSHVWDEAHTRNLIEACMSALLTHGEHLEVGGVDCHVARCTNTRSAPSRENLRSGPSR